MTQPHNSEKAVLVATDDQFSSQVLGNPQLCLVDFWAPWCGPCRQIAPLIEQIAAEKQGQVQVFKMNVDEQPKTAAQFQIRGIPTLLLFFQGKVVDQLVGAHPKEAILRSLEKHLKS